MANVIEFGAWEPDQPVLGGAQAYEARNVIPAKRGYRSLPSLADMGKSALPDRAIDAYSFKSLGGDLYTLAGTGSGLYMLSGANWTQKYTDTASILECDIINYGNTIYALFSGKLLKMEIGSGAPTIAPVEGAPGGRTLGIMSDFLVIGRVTGRGNAIRWSAIDNPDSWPEPGSNAAQYVLADIQVFPLGGNVQSIVGGFGGVSGMIFMEEALYRAEFVGTPAVFQFTIVDRARGTAAPRSPVVCETMCLFLAPDGWYATNGDSVTAIGAERIDNWFFKTLDTGRISEVRGVWDVQNRVALWSFPSLQSPDGVHDYLLVYNYKVDKWSYARMQTECLFQDHVRGISLEELDVYGTLNDVPFASLDDPALKNGAICVSAFDAQHRISGFTGQSLEALIDTQESGGTRMMVHGIRPLVDRGDAESCPVYRATQNVVPTVGTMVKQSRDGVCYQHVSTNYMRARVRIPAGDAWLNAVGCEVLTEQEGGM